MSMAKIIIGILLVIGILFFGCINQEQLVGGDKDEHGCIASAGYVWCDEKGKCIRPWEENCTSAQIVGNDSDEHGCIGSAGYSWCESSQKCYRPWEENCSVACTEEAKICPDGSAVGRTGPNCEFAPCPQLVGNDSDEHGCIASAGYSWCESSQKCYRTWEESCFSDLQKEGETFCGKENIAAIYICDPYIRTVSSLLGGGSTFYENGIKIAECPVVGPDSMSEECRQLLLGNNCIEQEINCQNVCYLNGTNYMLNLNDAEKIANASECSQSGLLLESASCNYITGTWWIDLELEKPGCMPACVIDVEKKSAGINWRCTGLAQE